MMHDLMVLEHLVLVYQRIVYNMNLYDLLAEQRNLHLYLIELLITASFLSQLWRDPSFQTNNTPNMHQAWLTMNRLM